MQEQKSNREKDNFSEMIKNKLADYSLPVDDTSWNEIEKRLNKKPPKRSLWISGLVAAASIALLIILLPNKKNNNHETANTVPGYEETIGENVLTEEIHQPAQPPAIRPEKKPKPTEAHRKYADNHIVVEPEVIEEEKTPENTIPEPAPKENQIQYPTVGLPDDEPLPIKKRKKQKSIGLSLGSGGNLLAMNNNDLLFVNTYYDSKFLAYPSNIASSSPGVASDVLFSTTDFSDITHLPPLSFGLTARKELNSVFSLETGIVYTFLQSEFSNRIPKREAKLQLHYLGIPVNLNADIYRNKHAKWGIYLSVGGMLEKGVLSHYSQKYYGSNDLIVNATTLDENIDGLQWSVSLAPGIDYKLNKNYSIYLEPKISYYFDNNQPISARTEHPVVFGVNAGFRFSW